MNNTEEGAAYGGTGSDWDSEVGAASANVGESGAAQSEPNTKDTGCDSVVADARLSSLTIQPEPSCPEEPGQKEPLPVFAHSHHYRTVDFVDDGYCCAILNSGASKDCQCSCPARHPSKFCGRHRTWEVVDISNDPEAQMRELKRREALRPKSSFSSFKEKASSSTQHPSNVSLGFVPDVSGSVTDATNAATCMPEPISTTMEPEEIVKDDAAVADPETESSSSSSLCSDLDSDNKVDAVAPLNVAQHHIECVELNLGGLRAPPEAPAPVGCCAPLVVAPSQPLLVRLRNHHGTHLQGNNGRVYCSRNALEWETWAVEVKGDKVSLRDHNNNYLRASSSGSLSTVPTAGEQGQWTVVTHPSVPGRFALRSHFNTYLRADADQKHVNLVPHVLEWEAWDILSARPANAQVRHPDQVVHPTEHAGLAVLRNHHGTHLQGNGGQVCCSHNALEWETWTVVPRDTGKVSLRDHNNNYLRASSSGSLSTVPTAGEREEWSVVPHPLLLGRFALRSHFNTYLRADADQKHVNLVPHVLEWEAWDILSARPVTRSPCLPVSWTLL